MDPTDQNTDVGAVETNEELHPLSRANIRRIQSEDPDCQKVKPFIETETRETVKVSKQETVKASKEERKGWGREAQLLFQASRKLTINPADGIIEYRGERAGGRTQPTPYIPKTLRKEAFRSVHCAPDAGHWSRDSTVERARRYFFWPELSQDVRAWVAACDICVTKRRSTDNKDCTYQPRYSGYPMQTIYVDT